MYVCCLLLDERMTNPFAFQPLHFSLTMSKTYRYAAEGETEQAAFIETMVKTIERYMGGRPPKLIGIGRRASEGGHPRQHLPSFKQTELWLTPRSSIPQHHLLPIHPPCDKHPTLAPLPTLDLQAPLLLFEMNPLGNLLGWPK